jgi:F-type H+/Na+-transporting ATPase subunit alpha
MTYHDADVEVQLEKELTTLTQEIRQAMTNRSPKISWTEVGRVTSVLSGVVQIEGLPSVGSEEILTFENGATGIAFNIDEKGIGCVLTSASPVKAGMHVESTGRIADVPVGSELIGRVIDPTGRPLDNRGELKSLTREPVEREAPLILDRDTVSQPLSTGIKVIDALIPIGKGQRELILGDRQTGKTAIAIDTIINQKGKDVLCVYCAIGQRSASVSSLIATLRKYGCMEYTIVVVAEGNDPPGLRFLAPYAATTIAEYFMRRGQDALIIYDDLTNHARTYREISLLLRRPPGREAYPGDIFYIHSRLLERSAKLTAHLGGGSLTALPVIETQAQDISAYIPTNLISITDGQIFLSTSMFQKNLLPAVDIGRSVSRVGGRAQYPAFRSVSSALKLAYSQFEELESFSRFGTRVDPATRSVLEHGQRIRNSLLQPRYEPIPVMEQIATFLSVKYELMDSVPIENLHEAEKECRAFARELDESLAERFLLQTPVNPEDLETILHGLTKRLRKHQQ